MTWTRGDEKPRGLRGRWQEYSLKNDGWDHFRRGEQTVQVNVVYRGADRDRVRIELSYAHGEFVSGTFEERRNGVERSGPLTSDEGVLRSRP